MNTKYSDLINQNYYFPQEEFNLTKDNLQFHDIDLMKLVDKLTNAAKDIIHETIRAQKHGCIDLKKWEIPENADKIKVTVEE